ncbi:tautomerase family protein [Streptomyces sp. NPDC091368]|uniref:tautomerase family protein n=1 Tax=Streptomyces sp. NPDC091368 TaxID=3365993 RepID=UPI003826D518
MPLWTVHHTPGVFSDADRRGLASSVADHYEKAGLPRFYVVTLFQETRSEDFYVGGEPASAGVRITIDHIARHHRDGDGRRRTARWIRRMVEPYLEGHAGLHWEFHVDETSEEMWMINGLVPPPGGSDAERHWAEQNAATPY